MQYCDGTMVTSHSGIIDNIQQTDTHLTPTFEKIPLQTDSQLTSPIDASRIIPHNFPQEKLTNSLVRSKIESITQEISELDLRVQNIQLIKSDKRKPPQLPYVPAPTESETEHIYETIPESLDSEAEPIYSCPYESGDNNLIEQWLTAHNNNWNSAHPKEVFSKEKKPKSKSSKSNSSGEEHENSSSAYNTGGSCNSNPLTFELACSLDPKHKDNYRYEWCMFLIIVNSLC